MMLHLGFLELQRTVKQLSNDEYEKIYEFEYDEFIRTG